MDYIKDRDKILHILKNRLSDEKYIHSLSTESRAIEMAERFGADKQKAGFAGLIHDITKCVSDEEALAKQYDINYTSKKTIHQWTGALYIREQKITDDEDIINAVRSHTTGCANMTLLQKIIYLADATEKNRNYPCVNELRQLCNKDINDAMLFSLKKTIEKLQADNKPIDYNTLEAYNYLYKQKTRRIDNGNI